MNYLYGDSTPSQLKSNFLEVLRDALDFCVFVLQSDATIKQGKADIRALSEEADAESARLDRFIKGVSLAVDHGEKGQPDSPTARCGQRIYSLIADQYRSSLEGIRQTLSDGIARIDADESSTRESCLAALGALLAPHDPPNADSIVHVVLDGGRYSATIEGKAEPALEWSLTGAIPDGNVFASTLRVDRIAPHLEIRAPQLTGWITKEVKIRPQKLERHLVTKVVDDQTTLAFELRLETALESVFDFEVAIEDKTVKATRVAPAEDQSAGVFELHPDDVGPIVELATKLKVGVDGIEREETINATVDGTDFRALPGFVEFVERLVATMAPIVREISARSLTPTELVLRRKLGDDRREEIFVTKATLREKLIELPDDVRWIFAPLGLDVGGEKPVGETTAVRLGKTGLPSLRSELPPSTGSKPPTIPPPAAPPKAPSARPPATYPPAMTSAAARSLRRPPPPTTSAVASNVKRNSSPQLEVGEAEIELAADDVVPDSERRASKPTTPPEPPSDPGSSPTSPGGEKRNEALVAALKKIMTLSKNGRAIEAYQEYASLFSSAAFAEYRIEDQRQALKLLVLAKTHPPDTAAVETAHRAALRRLEALVNQAHEPADQEMLGVAHLVLGDEKAATAAFQAGLATERARNPQSDLIATLMRRVSSI